MSPCFRPGVEGTLTKTKGLAFAGEDILIYFINDYLAGWRFPNAKHSSDTDHPPRNTWPTTPVWHVSSD